MDTTLNDKILENIEIEFLNADLNHLRDEWDHYKYNNQFIPRVTHIIHSCQLDSDNLVSWANKMGKLHKDSEEIKLAAARLGTYVHNALEKYIKNGIEPDIMAMDIEDWYKNKIITCLEGFKSFWDNYRYKDLIQNVKVEETLVTPYFGGTYDLLVSLKDGRNYLYDFKTTNNIRESQFIQLSAYRYALRAYYNINLAGCAILKIDKYKPYCQEFMVDFSRPENLLFIDQCEKTFISMIYTYYNMIVTRNQFDEYRERRLL